MGKEFEMGAKILKFMKGIPQTIAVFLIMCYKVIISPLLPPCCRFVPTCSEYALIAFKRYGFKKGFVLTWKRLIRCRPGGGSGYDPVP